MSVKSKSPPTLLAPRSRSKPAVPVIYEVDNRDRRLAVNQTVFLRLLLTPSAMKPVGPEAAVIDDAGRPVVFVQVAGESFVRRRVLLGSASEPSQSVYGRMPSKDNVIR